MKTQQITAHFSSGEDLNAVLADLRRSGAIRHTGSLPYGGRSEKPVLHMTVRSENAALAKAIIRRAGGRM